MRLLFLLGQDLVSVLVAMDASSRADIEAVLCLASVAAILAVGCASHADRRVQCPHASPESVQKSFKSDPN